MYVDKDASIMIDFSAWPMVGLTVERLEMKPRDYFFYIACLEVYDTSTFRSTPAAGGLAVSILGIGNS